jgi:hypothetical protein
VADAAPANPGELTAAARAAVLDGESGTGRARHDRPGRDWQDAEGPGAGEPGPRLPGLAAPGSGGLSLDSAGAGTAGLADAAAALGHGLAGAGDDGPSQPGAAGLAAAGTYRGLPRRVRQANLSPHLRGERTASPQDPAVPPLSAPVPATERSPQEARDLMSSLQSGWQRGRDPDPPGAAGRPPGAGEAMPAPGVPGQAAGPLGWDTGPEPAGSEEN